MELSDKKIIRVFAKHDPYWNTGHIGEVMNEMKDLGPPTINVVEWRNNYYAVEGSHRLFAAFELGLVPILVVSNPDHFEPSDEDFWDKLELTLPHYSWLV